MTSDAETGYTARPDGTPVSNVMLQWLADRTTQRTWWRQDDDTWTDGDTICPWPDIERQGNNVTAYRPLSDPRILLHTALVEGDGLARALLAGELERFYGEEGWPQPRYHAIVELTRNPVLPLDQLLVATLRQCLNRHSDGGSTVIYRWDWTDSTSHLLDGPDAENPGPDEFVVYGLLPRKAHLFVLRCPISKDQERDVVQWLRGPRMLGALRDLWSPLLDTVPATPRRPGDPS
jgi:hypothetical protein